MGVLHHAEALTVVAETFDHHTAGGAAEDHFNAKPAGRVADVAALVILASWVTHKLNHASRSQREHRRWLPLPAARTRCTRAWEA